MPVRPSITFAAALAATVGLGCQSLAGIGDVTLAKDASTDVTDTATTTETETEGETATDTAKPETPPAPCASDRGPEMVRIDGGVVGKFCIDTTEVTVDQFEVYATAGDKPPPQARCVGDATVVPRKIGGENGTLPRYSANWCHAAAFCEWSNKRLCRPEEWGHACRGGAPGTAFPYGAAYDMAKCVTNVANHSPVKTATACHGATAPYDAIFDMSGNLAEWVDDCDTDEVGKCRPRGGYYEDVESKYFDCDPSDAVEVRPFTQNHKGNGFRCCKDSP